MGQRETGAWLTMGGGAGEPQPAGPLSSPTTPPPAPGLGLRRLQASWGQGVCGRFRGGERAQGVTVFPPTAFPALTCWEDICGFVGAGSREGDGVVVTATAQPLSDTRCAAPLCAGPVPAHPPPPSLIPTSNRSVNTVTSPPTLSSCVAGRGPLGPLLPLCPAARPLHGPHTSLLYRLLEPRGL